MNDLPATLAAARGPVELAEGAGADYWFARRLARDVERVLRFAPGARCLARSVVVVKLLARRGLACKIVIGVASEPDFRAHAWVELDGIPLLPALESEYARLVEL